MYHFLQKLIRLLRPSQANGNLVQRVPPFIFYLFYVTYKTGRDQRVPPFPGLEINRSPPVVTNVPPKPHRWTTAVASADFAVATGGPPVDHRWRYSQYHRWPTEDSTGGHRSSTGGHRLFYRGYNDDAGPAKIGRNLTEL